MKKVNYRIKKPPQYIWRRIEQKREKTIGANHLSKTVSSFSRSCFMGAPDSTVMKSLALVGWAGGGGIVVVFDLSSINSDRVPSSTNASSYDRDPLRIN